MHTRLHLTELARADGAYPRFDTKPGTPLDMLTRIATSGSYCRSLLTLRQCTLKPRLVQRMPYAGLRELSDEHTARGFRSANKASRRPILAARYGPAMSIPVLPRSFWLCPGGKVGMLGLRIQGGGDPVSTSALDRSTERTYLHQVRQET